MCCRRCARRRSSSENRRGSGRRNDDGGRRSWLSRALCNETLVTALSCCCSKHTVLGGQHRAVLGWMHATSKEFCPVSSDPAPEPKTHAPFRETCQCRRRQIRMTSRGGGGRRGCMSEGPRRGSHPSQRTPTASLARQRQRGAPASRSRPSRRRRAPPATLAGVSPTWGQLQRRPPLWSRLCAALAPRRRPPCVQAT